LFLRWLRGRATIAPDFPLIGRRLRAGGVGQDCGISPSVPPQLREVGRLFFNPHEAWWATMLLSAGR